MARDEKTLASTTGTILVVEDEQAQRETLCAFLGEEYTMLEAGNGAEALAHVSENPVDLVFLDHEDGARGASERLLVSGHGVSPAEIRR